MTRYFDDLTYSLGDEDNRVELAALPPRADCAVAVAGSGVRAVALLAQQPQRLLLCDISEPQLHLTRLRLAALRTLDFATYTNLIGYGGTPEIGYARERRFKSLPLAQETRNFLLRRHERHPATPLAYWGKFEHTMIRFSKLIRWVLGSAADQLFECQCLEDQRRYVQEKFPHRRWRLLTRLLGNAAVLNGILYGGEFPKNNRPTSAYRIYQRVFDGLFNRIPARESFFLQLLFQGAVTHAAGFPLDCQPETFGAAKRALESVEPELWQGDFEDAVQRAGVPVDFLAVSDVPSFLPAARERSYLVSMRQALATGARVVSRGHLREVRPHAEGYEDITPRFSEAIAGESTQLWEVRIHARSG